MKVTLLHHTPLSVCAHAVRTCWQSFDRGDNGGPKDQELIDRVGNKFKHASTLEHLVYTFYAQGFSRAVLQELARHRIASYSIKSTRYTLKELKDIPYIQDIDWDVFEKFCVSTGVDMVDQASFDALVRLQQAIKAGIPNDKAKYCMPEAYRVEGTITINARSLQNFLSLRTDKAALWEIQNLAHAIAGAIPTEHLFLFKEHIKEPG